MQYSVTLRNNQLDQIEATPGVSPLLRMYSGAAPVDCATVASGTLIAEMVLPSDWMNAAAAGTKTKLGTWSDVSANAAGILGYFRIYDSTGTTCHVQGTITITGGGGDMIVDNTNVALAQSITVSTFSVSAGNA